MPGTGPAAAYLILCLAAATSARASSIDVALRADPIVFALGGWSVGLDAAPTMNPEDPTSPRARFSLAAFHVEVPALLLPVVASPSDGLRVIEDAAQIAVRFDLGGGWWAGPEVYVYRLTYLRDDDDDDDVGAGAGVGVGVGRDAYVHASIGWRWFFADGVPLLEFFFVEPWATIGLPVYGTGGATVRGVRIDDRGFNWHATVSVGADVW